MTSIYHDFPVLKNAAIVRELHTYGTALNLKQTRSDAAQHKGYGKMLMLEAEKIAKREGYGKVAVISGIGVREYYKMLGYRLKDTYMTKAICSDG
jgi:elongator complex protein 3